MIDTLLVVHRAVRELQVRYSNRTCSATLTPVAERVIEPLSMTNRLFRELVPMMRSVQSVVAGPTAPPPEESKETGIAVGLVEFGAHTLLVACPVRCSSRKLPPEGVMSMALDASSTKPVAEADAGSAVTIRRPRAKAAMALVRRIERMGMMTFFP
ncbi:MAG TPA: hypothetical protein VFU19_02390 [Iamia sp.]|nr:hypothetical protein [Iamia sp.]